MNDHGLKLLANETAEQIRKNAAGDLTKKMHVHVKGMPRKKEIEELQNSDEFRAELKKLLDADPLYRDCVELNKQPGSLLLERYLEDEEAFDAVADNCSKRIIPAARKYTAKKEKKLLEAYDLSELIAEARGPVKAGFIRNMKDHLLNDRLEICRIQESRQWGQWSNAMYTALTPDTYDEFDDMISGMDEEILLSFAGYSEYNFGTILASEIEELHPELTEFRVIRPASDIWADELYEKGYGIFLELKKHFRGPRLFRLVCRNRYLKKEFEGMRLLREELQQRVPDRMPDLFPAARNMTRCFIIHVGPTNSGKTYSSVERLKTAERGIYLGPLRLLAFEQYQKLNEQGYPCSLYTGEEHQLIPGAGLQASTIEMANEYDRYDIAVIDEAQMVADRERGWAWTTAILGLRADEIHVCIAPYAVNIITSLIEDCGDPYEIVYHSRQTPLVCDRSDFRLKKNYIHKHDALIVFSRRNVHAVAGELKTMGISCSVIYGNLPYDVRQEEARRFREGETDVVVATDAIGMGMNLPIERLVFLEISKYDGTETRLLRPAEIQQIVGRAGRRGLYEKGLWNAIEGRELIEDAVNIEIPQIKSVYAGFPESLINIEGKLSSIINEWRNIEPPEGYYISALEHEYELCCWLEERTDDKRLIYRLITIPFDEDDRELRSMWNRSVSLILHDGSFRPDRIDIETPHSGLSLSEAEQLYKKYDLAYAFTEKFGEESDSEIILQYKKELSGIITDILKESGLPFRTCKICGKKLRWNFPYGICPGCYDEKHRRRGHRWKEFY